MLRASGFAVLGLSAIAFVGAASAGGPKPVKLDPVQARAIVDARQAGMLLSGVAMGSMKDAVDRGLDPKTQRFAARSLGRWARTVPGVFPVGTNLPESGALPVVWTDRAGFEAKAKAYADATAKLAEAAAAGDKEAFAVQWTATRTTCGSCHDTYKKADEKPH